MTSDGMVNDTELKPLLETMAPPLQIWTRVRYQQWGTCGFETFCLITSTSDILEALTVSAERW